MQPATFANIVSSPLRLLASTVGLVAALTAAAFAWEWARFGFTTLATAARVEREVRDTVSERITEVEDLARRVAAESRVIDEATRSTSALPALFESLRQLAEPADQHRVAITVYVPAGSTGAYRVLAWSDGPGERNLSAERLAGPPTLFVAPGHAGLRLLRVEPVEHGGTRLAVAVAETVLAPVDRASASAERRLPTRFGSVTVIEQYASARDDVAPARGFVIEAAPGVPLLEVHVDDAQLSDRRGQFRD